MDPPLFSGHVHALRSWLSGTLLPCTLTETGDGTSLRESHVVSQENPLSLVSVNGRFRCLFERVTLGTT